MKVIIVPAGIITIYSIYYVSKMKQGTGIWKVKSDWRDKTPDKETGFPPVCSGFDQPYWFGTWIGLASILYRPWDA